MTSSLSVDGVISGLRTGDIVDQLMALERRPLTLLQQRKTRLQQRAAAMADLSSTLEALQTKIANLTLASATNIKTTTSSAGTQVTATATADAVNGNYKVNISQIATATRARSTTALGQAISRVSSLSTAGFATTPTNGTLSINGVAVTVADVTSTTLDDGTGASLVSLINAAGAGVTASVVADSDGRLNRLQLLSSAGQSIQLGAGADTSNLMSVLNLSGAQVTGNTAANVDGTPVVAAGTISTSFTINGTTVTLNTDAGNTAAQNAVAIQDAINAAGAGVTASVNVDDSLHLATDTLGSSTAIVIAGAVAGTGLSVGTTQNGTDKVVSTANLGTISSSAAISGASSRLSTAIAGLDVDGNGSFKINGVAISFNGSEALSTILSRINASGAGVAAVYDRVTDQVTLTANTTGTALISLEDVTGNFLSAVGVSGATQSVGQNALYTVDSVNGGQQLSSQSNTVSGIIPGVTLYLQDVTTSEATIRVSQDTGTATTAVQGFVDQYNKAVALIHKYKDYNATTKQSAVLTNDTRLVGIESQLRRLLSASAIGATGSYKTMVDIGVSTGKYGSAVGTTGTLTLDTAKLTTALQDNPSAVNAVLGRFSNTATLAGVGPISTISGAPTNNHEPGQYQLVSADGTTIAVTFTPTSGTAKTIGTISLAAAATNTTLISGVTLTGSGVAGTSTITNTVSARGVGVTVKDYLNGLTSTTGLFDTADKQSDTAIADLDKQAVSLQQRLEDKETALRRRFTLLEVAMSKLQSQSTQLAGTISSLNSSSGS